MMSLIEKIKRMLFWAWKMRNSYDFDYVYVEEMLLIKLKRLRHSMNNCPYHHSKQSILEELKQEDLDEETRKELLQSLRYYKSIDFAIKLLERRSSASTYYDDISGITQFYDENPLDFRQMMLHSKESRLDYYNKLKPLILIREKMIDRDKKMLYNTIAKYIEGWWV